MTVAGPRRRPRPVRPLGTSIGRRLRGRRPRDRVGRHRLGARRERRRRGHHADRLDNGFDDHLDQRVGEGAGRDDLGRRPSPTRPASPARRATRPIRTRARSIRSRTPSVPARCGGSRTATGARSPVRVSALPCSTPASAQVRGARRRRQGRPRPGPVDRGEQRRSDRPGHLRPRHPHGRHHRRARPGDARPGRPSPSSRPRVQLGVAPDAELSSFKLATTDGSTDVSQVIAALDWVTQHPVMADGMRIRVVNLSFGTDSVQPYQVDPLAAAAENAWRHGIVVVVSAGNEGTGAGRLTDPAMDPYVLAVGASDGTDPLAGWADATQWPRSAAAAPPTATSTCSRRAARSSRCATRARSSTSTTRKAWCTATRPAGCSAAAAPARPAAVTTGAIALLLQAYPNLTPDQVKDAAHPDRHPGRRRPIPSRAGAGQLDVAGALLAAQAHGHAGAAATSSRPPAAPRPGRTPTGQGSHRGRPRRRRSRRPAGRRPVRRDRRPGQRRGTRPPGGQRPAR